MNACITFIKSCLEFAIHSEQLASINYSKYNVEVREARYSRIPGIYIRAKKEAIRLKGCSLV